MNESDIKYALELLNDAISEKDWDKAYELKELLTEFLDDENSDIDD